jgi:hypothetical protein
MISMKSKTSNARTSRVFTSQEMVQRFRKAAGELTTKASVSKQAALDILTQEGIYTKAGKLSKNYSN